MAEFQRRTIKAAECKLIMKAGHGGIRTIYAYFDAKKNVVVLPKDFSMKSAYDRSILVHELTHVLQERNGIRVAHCQFEYPAYKAQQKYLIAQGQALKPLAMTNADILRRARCDERLIP
ncbi:DUF4157 domain-containing protein [Phyllobacterium sp. LjRoot231]|uniref:DUF6647 family protein n=1 Tax=Phyllobacterium sp. LjRoot231 TaxID=3342289 RepID=UPI003ECF0237